MCLFQSPVSSCYSESMKSLPTVSRIIVLVLLLSLISVRDNSSPLEQDIYSSRRPSVLGTSTEGSMRVYQPVTLTFDGPQRSENEDTFMDYRLDVTFTKGGKSYKVPGYFAADGNAANSNADSGNKWRVHFTPDESGTWNYSVSFRTGNNIAVNGNSGSSAGAPDGETGSFSVSGPDANAPGFLAKGRLEYVGGHYLRFQDGDYFIKTGTDSPENMLAFVDFDNTQSNTRWGELTFASHVTDWNNGDPTWDGGKGKGLIGALNWLSENGANSVYFLTMNIGGDGKDVWPYAGNISNTGGNINTTFDVSKLDQWKIVLEHAQKKGLMLHVVLNETETGNKLELDGGNLGNERKLYYRELVARFGYNNAVVWNIGEEANQSNTDNIYWERGKVESFANSLMSYDPYDHPVAVHGDWALNKYGASNILDVASFQWYPDGSTSGQGGSNYSDKIENIRSASKDYVIGLDEPNRTGKDSRDDNSHSTNWPFISGSHFQRKDVTWPALLSGAHVEYLLEDSLGSDNFKLYSETFKYAKYAREFLEALPFNEMSPDDNLLTGEREFGSGHTDGGQVFAKRGEVYAVYLPNASGTPRLNLSHTSGNFTVRWYNPRTGQFSSSSTTVSAGGNIDLIAPSDRSNDWAVLVTGSGTSNPTGSSYCEQNGRIVIEAENFDSQNGYSILGTSGASGTAIQAANSFDSNIANYKLNFENGGRWHFFVRSQASDHENNGLFMEINGNRMVAPSDHDLAGTDVIWVRNYDMDGTTPVWNWETDWQDETGHRNPSTVDLPSGEFNLGVVKRVPNRIVIERPIIDKIMFTRNRLSDSELRALGKGPAATYCDGPPVTVTPSPGGGETVSFNPTEDAYLENAQRYNDSVLKVETSSSRTRTTYMKFDVSGIDSSGVENVNLILKESGDPGSGPVSVYIGSHNNWTESNLSDSNKPEKGAKLGTFSGDIEDGSTITVPLDRITRNGTYTLIVESDNTSSGADVSFGSSESGLSPSLEMTVSDGAGRSGDYDGDGDVDGADRALVKFHFGSTYDIFDYNNVVYDYGS